MPRVLAADDEAVSRIVLARMLSGLGFDVTEAADVPEAAELLTAGDFDLIVTDYQMPSGTGLDLVEAAKAADIPFILLTGIGGEGNLDDDRADLIDVHLTKPVSSSDLADAVNRVLGTMTSESSADG